MSTDCDYNQRYKINDLANLSHSELSSLLKEAVSELNDLSLKYQEYECKFAPHLSFISY